MATKSPDKKIKIPRRIMDGLVDALDLAKSIEMANVPRACMESAAASWLCANRKPNVWVQIHMDGKTQDFKYDLRPGHEADEDAQ